MSMKVFSFDAISDLFDDVDPFDEPCKVLDVKPRRRSYLTQQDVVYDFHAGAEFIVIDSMSPFAGCTISVLDRADLSRHGYDMLRLRFNYDRSVEVQL